MKKELRGLSPNFHIHVSVSDLYIPRIGPHIFLSRICRPIVWKLGPRIHSPLKDPTGTFLTNVSSSKGRLPKEHHVQGTNRPRDTSSEGASLKGRIVKGLLAVNVATVVATVLGSIPTTSDTVESEGRQMKQHPPSRGSSPHTGNKYQLLKQMNAYYCIYMYVDVDLE